jgi:hypothetical protein
VKDPAATKMKLKSRDRRHDRGLMRVCLRSSTTCPTWTGCWRRWPVLSGAKFDLSNQASFTAEVIARALTCENGVAKHLETIEARKSEN